MNTAKLQAERRRRLKAEGLCEECGRPALVRILAKPDGTVLLSRTMSRCEKHTPKIPTRKKA